MQRLQCSVSILTTSCSNRPSSAPADGGGSFASPYIHQSLLHGCLLSAGDGWESSSACCWKLWSGVVSRCAYMQLKIVQMKHLQCQRGQVSLQSSPLAMFVCVGVRSQVGCTANELKMSLERRLNGTAGCCSTANTHYRSHLSQAFCLAWSICRRARQASFRYYDSLNVAA